MLFISIPNRKRRSLGFYLALEEYILNNFSVEAIFVWQVDPSVIIGRNQVLLDEVNIDFCKDNNIKIYRRRSGGGCVYSDNGNLMISHITRTTNVDMAFSDHIKLVLRVLNEFGINAETTSKNDIIVDGGKVSGNAVRYSSKGCVIHGTLLFDANLTQLEQAITPSVKSLSMKGIQSVRQRVVNLKDYVTCSDTDFISELKKQFNGELYILGNSHIKCVEIIEKEYLNEDFIYSK